jgi:hypothetical protein
VPTGAHGFMKRITFLVALFTVTFFSVSTQAEWAFIKVLRGDPQDSVPLQRVAFVGTATVKGVQGKAERLSGIDSWSPVKKGATLKPGDLVRVLNGSLVLKMTESESFVKVTPNTLLHLLSYEQNWDRAILTGAEEKSGFVVRSCRGSASYRDRAGEWQPVQVNAVLPQTAIIRTEAQTTVDLFCTTTHHVMRVQGPRQLDLANANSTGMSSPALAAIVR